MQPYYPPDYSHALDDKHRLGFILRELLETVPPEEASFASGYFDLGAWEILCDGLEKLAKFRLLLGSAPDIRSSTAYRLTLDQRDAWQENLEEGVLDETYCALVDRLLAFLRREEVQVRLLTEPFLHAKAYLIPPQVAIAGSHNFTKAGLETNAELSLIHKSESITRDLLQWYDAYWEKANDFKGKLVETLEASKYGRPYTPFEVFIRALYERFRDALSFAEGREAVVELARFQEQGLREALLLLERHWGVMVADAVGLGKTFIALRIMEHYLIARRRKGFVPKGLVICPAQLRDSMWKPELDQYGIPATIVSQELVGQEDFDWRQYQNYDLVVVDESHNFRTPGANRYRNLSRLIASGRRDKRVVLLTATPINNSLWDLYHQFLLLTRGSDTYYHDYGIPNLEGFFRMVARNERDIFTLLEHTTVRRSRADVRRQQEAGERIEIAGQEVRFPERELHSVNYSLTSAYPGVFKEIVHNIEQLHLVPYNLARYLKAPSEENGRVVDRGEALIGIQKVLFLKRLESSVAAFQRTVETQREFQAQFCEQLERGKLLGAADARRLRALERRLATAEGEDQPQSVQDLLGNLEAVNLDDYDMEAIRQHCAEDNKRLKDIVEWVELAVQGKDTKGDELKALLAGDDLKGQKVILFTYYKDTANHIHASLTGDAAWLARAGNPTIERLTGDTPRELRGEIIKRFAPVSNTPDNDLEQRRQLEKTPVDIVVCTDVLSEGQNLQDAGILVNYDLHWNPVRMIQRAGRIDRLKSLHETVHLYNFFPQDELEDLLQLVSRIWERLQVMAGAGFLDTSTMGEAVSDKSMQALRRIQDQDHAILDELEQELELATAQDMRLPLLMFIQKHGAEQVKRIPLGVHSGMRAGEKRPKGVFVAFRAEDRHFWRFLRADGEIESDYRRIFAWIQCTPDMPCELPPEATQDRPTFRAGVFAQLETARQDVLQEIRKLQARTRLPQRLSGLNKRVHDTLNTDDARKALPEDQRQMLNNVLVEIPLGPFAREPGFVQLQRMLRNPETDVRAIADQLYEAFVDAELFRTLGTRPDAPMITEQDLKLVNYEIVW